MGGFQYGRRESDGGVLNVATYFDPCPTCHESGEVDALAAETDRE
jgi:hypothetical protein